MSSDGKRKGHNDDEAESYRPPKLPKTLSEKNSSQRLIVVLEGAGLETAKVGRKFELLSASDHGNIIAKAGRDGVNLRPDITHQCLLMLLDSPLNKAGKLQVYIHTAKNVLIEINPQTRIPRVYNRFAGLMVQLLHSLSISAKGKSAAKLLKVIKNPITDHLPTGCPRIGTSYGAKKSVKLRDYLPKVATDQPLVVVVGAIAHGAIDIDYTQQDVAVSDYAMSAAGVCAKLTDACEDMWDIF